MDQDFVGVLFRRIVSVQDDLAALSVVAFTLPTLTLLFIMQSCLGRFLIKTRFQARFCPLSLSFPSLSNLKQRPSKSSRLCRHRNESASFSHIFSHFSRLFSGLFNCPSTKWLIERLSWYIMKNIINDFCDVACQSIQTLVNILIQKLFLAYSSTDMIC